MEQEKQCLGCMEFYDAGLDACPYCGYEDGMESSHLLHLVPGTILHNRYIIGKSLGYGSFGVTYIGWDRLLKHKVAIKEYLPSEFATRMIREKDLIIPDAEAQKNKYDRGMSRFRREAEKLAQLGQIDGVVYVYDTFDENNTAYIIMEYLQGETLASYMERNGIISEERTLKLMLPVLQSLQAVHEHGIIHRDISPDNIFISTDSAGNEKVKLIDFGAAKFASSSHSKSLTVLLRPGYSPEEQYRSSGEQGPHTDVYAIAAVMYHMVTGKIPPDALERRTSVERKKRELLKTPSQLNPDLSENFEIALMNALNVKIEDRTPTADEFIAELISFEKVKRRGSSIKKIDFMKWPLWAKIGVPVGGAAAVAVIVGVSMMLSGLISSEVSELPDGYTRVPYFVGASMEQAETVALENALAINQAGTEYSPNVDENLIVRQDTMEGFIVAENSIINLTVSTGVETYLLPDVMGMSVENARAALECMGLEVLTEEEVQKGLAGGSVISQSIDPFEEVHSGDTITLEITSEEENSVEGTKKKNAPDFEKMLYEDALAYAADQNLELVVAEKVFSKEYEDSEIIDQSIAEGEDIGENGIIEVTVSLAWREFNMPNLMYKSQDIAVQLMKNIGIDAVVTQSASELVAQGLVFEQTVAKDTTVEPGQDVGISVSTGSTPFDMVNVVGLTEEDARAKLQESKLAVTVEYDYDEKVAEGNVISQSVKAGEQITRGSEVTIVVCSTKDLVVVQDVSGKSSGDAKKELEAQGFTVQINEVYSATVEKGKVIEQLPDGGSSQKSGATVILTVSKGAQSTSSESKGSLSANKNDTGNKTNGSGSWRWSEWSTSAPAGNDYETKTQYRYRTCQTTTSDSDTLAGWTLYNTTSSWGEYGAWSSWSTTAISQSDSTQAESKTQSRYQDKETTTSTSSSLSGWTQVGSPSTSYGSYGNWSAWQKDAVSSSDTREVQTGTLYRYYYFYCPKCGGREPLQGLSDCKNYTLTASDWNVGWFTTPYASSSSSAYSYATYKRYTTSLGDGKKWNFSAGNLNSTAVGTKDTDSGAAVICTGYRYRDRSKTTTYTYERWGAWSSWSDSTYSKSNTRNVQTRTVYRFRTRSKINKYYFEKWGDWSAYSDAVVEPDESVDVQTRILYRYKIYDE